MLVAHELPVVFAEGARIRSIPGIGFVAAARPFPEITEELSQAVVDGSLRFVSRDIAPATRIRDVRMEPSFVDEVPADLASATGDLPFGLRRQPRARLTRERVGFE